MSKVAGSVSSCWVVFLLTFDQCVVRLCRLYGKQGSVGSFFRNGCEAALLDGCVLSSHLCGAIGGHQVP